MRVVHSWSSLSRLAVAIAAMVIVNLLLLPRLLSPPSLPPQLTGQIVGQPFAHAHRVLRNHTRWAARSSLHATRGRHAHADAAAR